MQILQFYFTFRVLPIALFRDVSEWVLPPIRFLASSTVTLCPKRCSWRAAPRPDIPAPTTMTVYWLLTAKKKWNEGRNFSAKNVHYFPISPILLMGIEFDSFFSVHLLLSGWIPEITPALMKPYLCKNVKVTATRGLYLGFLCRFF